MRDYNNRQISDIKSIALYNIRWVAYLKNSINLNYMKLRIKTTKTTLLIFGIYQILGALAGFGIVAWLLQQTGTINGIALLIFLIAIGLYALSMKAGSVLLRKDYKRGIILSMINQLFQIVAIAVGGYKFDFSSGARLNTGFNFTDGFLAKFDFGLSSAFNISWNSGQEFFIYINILAIFLLYVLVDIYEELFKKKDSDEVVKLT